MMNPTGPVRLQGYRIAFPGYLPFNPGNDIPAGGPQKLLQLYQDQTWLKGNHDVRFGGSYVHITDDHTFSAYSNAVEALNTSINALTSLNNLVLGQILRFQTAINPNGYPGGTFVTPVHVPELHELSTATTSSRCTRSDNWSIGRRLKLNLGVRYEYFGPQHKSDPKYDSNFYWGDPDLDLNSATPQQILDSVRTGSADAVEREPDRHAVERGPEQLRARARIRVGRERRRQDRHPRRLWHLVRAELRQRHVQRALQPAAVPRGHDRLADRRSRRNRSTPTTAGRSPASRRASRRFPAGACATSIRTSRPPTRTSTACRSRRSCCTA